MISPVAEKRMTRIRRYRTPLWMQGFDGNRFDVDQPTTHRQIVTKSGQWNRSGRDLGTPTHFRCESAMKRMQKLTNHRQSVLTREFLGQIVAFLGIAGRRG
jgi:hypothetical protein